MRTVVRAVLFSAFLTIAVLCFGLVRKVQIDARCELARGEGLVASARLSESGDEWVAAGDAFVAAMACYVPFDAAPRRAAVRLLAVVDELAERDRSADAARLLGDALKRIDADTWLFVPLAEFRADLAGRLERVALGHHG